VPNLTYKAELLFQSQEDFGKILNVLKAEQQVFNEASKIHYGDGSKRKNSIVELHAGFYSKFRLAHPEIPSQIVIRGEQACLSAYRSIKSNKHEIHKAIEKKNLSIRLDKRIYTYKEDKIKLTSLDKRVTVDFKRYPKIEEMLKSYEFCDPLLFERDGKIWIALTFKVPAKPESIEKLAVGIDLGVNRVVATSEGKIFQDKKFNKTKRKLRFLKRRLRSKGTKSARRHLKKIRHKEANRNNNQSHLLANTIISSTSANVLVLEDLTGLKNPKSKKKKMSKSNNNKIGQVPFARLREILTYKAPIYGKTVLLIDPKFTSQIDSRTGLKDGLRKGSRYYCSDGVILDADLNASINITKRSKLPVSLGRNIETYGQAVVTQPIVFKSFNSK
jgi:IS605 OrfB family transposase